MRKLAVALVIAAAISLTVWLWPQHPSASTASAPTISITAPPFLPSAETDPIEVPASPAPSTDGPYSSRSDAKKAWEPVVEGFAIAYPDTTHLTRKQWLANLQPFLTQPVYVALAGTDLNKVPSGRYAGYEVLEQADESLTVRITYQEGWALVLYVVAVSDSHWVVDRFDRSVDFD